MSRDFFKFKFLGILTVLVVVAGFSAVAMLLWNWLMPDIFALPALNYWQTLGLAVLCRIFFGGIPLGHFAHRGFEQGRRDFTPVNRLREKWMNMSDEERKAFVEKEHGFRNFFHDRFSQHHGFCENGKSSGEPSSKGDASPKGDGNE
jgi:hypothetical protein